MAVAAVCEFNPFHNGHKYFVERAKELTGGEFIAVMSGSFTQRGEVAITDKFSRARSALENGVDLVVELPVVYSAASARRFAKAAVEIALSFKDVSFLAFGCECGDLELLKKAAFALEDSSVEKKIAELMKQGEYYPRAVERAAREFHGDKIGEILASPNNILAVEYIKSLAGSSVKPLPILRKGAAHDSKTADDGTASASYIRGLLRSGKNARTFMPCKVEYITFPERLECAVLYRLRTMTSAELAGLPDVSEGLENRIYDAVRKYNSTKEIISAVKTKRYTHARLRRIFICALLGITKDMYNLPVSYARVLGFTQSGAGLLKNCRYDVVTSVAKTLAAEPEYAELLKKDIFAADIAALAYGEVRACSTDFTSPVIKVMK